MEKPEAVIFYFLSQHSSYTCPNHPLHKTGDIPTSSDAGSLPLEPPFAKPFLYIDISTISFQSHMLKYKPNSSRPLYIWRKDILKTYIKIYKKIYI